MTAKVAYFLVIPAVLFAFDQPWTQWTALGALIFVLIWLVTKTLPRMTRDHQATVKSVCDAHTTQLQGMEDRWDQWEHQRHEDSRDLREAITRLSEQKR